MPVSAASTSAAPDAAAGQLRQQHQQRDQRRTSPRRRPRVRRANSVRKSRLRVRTESGDATYRDPTRGAYQVWSVRERGAVPSLPDGPGVGHSGRRRPAAGRHRVGHRTTTSRSGRSGCIRAGTRPNEPRAGHPGRGRRRRPAPVIARPSATAASAGPRSRARAGVHARSGPAAPGRRRRTPSRNPGAPPLTEVRIVVRWHEIRPAARPARGPTRPGAWPPWHRA